MSTLPDTSSLTLSLLLGLGAFAARGQLGCLGFGDGAAFGLEAVLDVSSRLADDERNDIRIEPQVYDATVLPAVLNVRDQPSMNGRPFAWIHRGDVVHVMGFTHGWAAIDQGGRLGFVYNTQITRP